MSKKLSLDILNKELFSDAVTAVYVARKSPGAEQWMWSDVLREATCNAVREAWSTFSGYRKVDFPYNDSFVLRWYLGHRKAPDKVKTERHLALKQRRENQKNLFQ